MPIVHGDPWMRCPTCDDKIRRTELKKMWPGIWACNFCWDPKPYDAYPPYMPKKTEGRPDPRGKGNPADIYLQKVPLPDGAYDPESYDPNSDYS